MCNCGKRTASQFEVTKPDGSTVVVSSEPAARAEVSKAGGGTYKVKR